MKGGGGDVKKLFRFPLDVMRNSVFSTQILTKIYRPRLKECDYHETQQYYDQNKWKLFLYCKSIFFVSFWQYLWDGCPILPAVFLT